MKAGDSRKSTLHEKKHKHEKVWSVELLKNSFTWLGYKCMTQNQEKMLKGLARFWGHGRNSGSLQMMEKWGCTR